VELARARGGRVWGLANVAGIHHLGDALETEEADWAQVLSINLTAPWLWSRAILPELVAGGGGSIVIITSINGSFARPRSLAYNSSKSGALGLVRSLAIDYGRQGVRTNSLSPGSVETDMLKRLFAASPDARQDHLDKTFAPRLGIPEDIAGACAFLLSDDAAYVNGADLRVDGARTIAI
jgi:NAD(P)-dependent dehydrogenase (short-subunit alcohol dehydrogenase family)